MTACINRYEDRFLENIDRRIGARTSGSSTFVPKYNGATERNVWRRDDASVEAPKATPVPRPVAPVVKKAAPVVAKAVEVEAPVTPVVEAPMPTLTELWEAERKAKECREEARLAKKTEAPPVVKPPEDFTWSQDLTRPKLKKPQRKGTGGQKSTCAPSAPVTDTPKCEVKCENLFMRIEDLDYCDIFAVYDDKSNGLKWRFDTKSQLIAAAKKPSGIWHVAAFVTACEEFAKKKS